MPLIGVSDVTNYNLISNRMPGNHLFDKTGVLRTLPKFKMMLNPNSYRMAHPIY